MFLMSGDAGEVCVRHGLHGHLLPDSRGSGTPGYRPAGVISDPHWSPDIRTKLCIIIDLFIVVFILLFLVNKNETSTN